jgi:hypothetical protein
MECCDAGGRGRLELFRRARLRSGWSPAEAAEAHRVLPNRSRRRTGRVRPEQGPATSWTCCIWNADGPLPRGGPPALERRSRAGARRRSGRRPRPVRLWCAGLAEPWSALPAQPGHTQPISGGDRRCQRQPVRAERSEPRSGGLDCRRARQLAVGTLSARVTGRSGQLPPPSWRIATLHDSVGGGSWSSPASGPSVVVALLIVVVAVAVPIAAWSRRLRRDEVLR